MFRYKDKKDVSNFSQNLHQNNIFGKIMTCASSLGWEIAKII